MEPQVIQSNRVEVVGQTDFIQKVYAWMAGGLLATSLAAYAVITTPAILEALLSNMILFYGLILVELGLVIYLSFRISKMSITQAQVVFFLYSVLNGVTLSLLLLVYTTSSVASAFLVTAGMFAIVSMYGYVTKKDLTGVGSFAFMALVGVILASLVNMFLKNEGFSVILSYITVIVFVGLTAYDTQKIKALNASLLPGSEAAQKGAVLGALTLYLDFINLFLAILRISGNRR